MPPLFQSDSFNGHAPLGLLPAPPAADRTPARREVEAALLSSGPARSYRPSLPGTDFSDSPDAPPLYRFYRDLPAMLMHQRVKLALNYYRSGVSNAQFRVTASSPAVQRFVETELRRFWDGSLDQVTGLDHDGAGYGFGWVGCQVYYTIREGLLSVERVDGFEPRDTVPLVTDAGQYVGFRVRRVAGTERGHADLWGPGLGPCKGFWYVHRPKKGRHHGLSVCYPAWRPWSRLARRNGAENNLDLGMYKYGVRPVIVRHPDNTQAAERQGPGPAEQSDGDKALELAEGIKSGAAIALKNTRDAAGEYAWDIPPMEAGLDPSPLIANVEHLEGEIDAGIGVPSELMEAAETGSGYSGRQIPLEGYFQAQQSNATSIVRQWKEQIGLPLVRWNFGRGAWFDVEVLPLLQTRMEASRPPSSPGGGPGEPGQPGQPPQPRPPSGPPPMLGLSTAAPRETETHDTKRPGEFAPKNTAGGTPARSQHTPGEREFMAQNLEKHRQRQEQRYRAGEVDPLSPEPYTAFDRAASQLGPADAARLQVHGIAAIGKTGKSLSHQLIHLLSHGIDPAQPFHAGPPVPGVYGMDTTRTNAPYLLVSDPDTPLRKTGVKHVILNDAVEGARDNLQKQFPHVNFVKASESAAWFKKHLASRPKPNGGSFRLATDPPRDDSGRFVSPDADPSGLNAADDAEALQAAATDAAKALSAEARAELLAILTGDAEPGAKLDRARAILSRYRDEFTRQLAGTRLAALLAGMRRVAGLVPEGAADAGDADDRAADPGTQALAAAVAGLPPADRETALAAIAPDMRAAVEQLLRATGAAALPPPPDEPEWLRGFGDQEGDGVTLPFIDEAVQDLRARRLLTRDQYVALDAQARAEAFTVAGLEEETALAAVQEALAATVDEGGGQQAFEERVEQALGRGAFLSEQHAELVYRANVMTALSNGQAAVLAHPLVQDHFPYAAIYETHDNRARPWHLALETAGLDGTNVYRVDDPTFQAVRPPSDFGCRGVWNPMSVAQAAAAGVQEAKRWLDTGRPPAVPQHVPLPPGWRQSPGWVRMATDAAGHEHARDGRFGAVAGEHGGKGEVPAQRANSRAAAYLALAAKVPAAALAEGRARVKAAHAKLAARYGSKYATAIVAAGLAGVPLPVPGSSLLTAAPLIAVAELHRALGRKAPAAVTLATAHAPAGGAVVAGKRFTGGEFVPASVLAKATAAEKAKLVGKPAGDKKPAAADAADKPAVGKPATAKTATATAAELAAARDAALAKFRAAPVPTDDEATQNVAGMKALGADRFEANARGNSKDRRASRYKLLKEFGDGEQCPCVYCGLLLVGDPEHGANTVERDKMYTAAQGGKYRHSNLVPACRGCNLARSDKSFEEFFHASQGHDARKP